MFKLCVTIHGKERRGQDGHLPNSACLAFSIVIGFKIECFNQCETKNKQNDVFPAYTWLHLGHCRKVALYSTVSLTSYSSTIDDLCSPKISPTLSWNLLGASCLATIWICWATGSLRVIHTEFFNLINPSLRDCKQGGTIYCMAIVGQCNSGEQKIVERKVCVMVFSMDHSEVTAIVFHITLYTPENVSPPNKIVMAA